MNDIAPYSSLKVRLVLSVAIIVTSVLAFFGASELKRIGAEEQNRLDASAYSALVRMASSLPSPLWDFNTKGLVAILRGEMAHPLISRIHVISHDDKILAQVERGANGDVEVKTDESINFVSGLAQTRQLFYNDGSGPQSVGKVVLTMDDTYVARAQHEALIRIAIAVVVLDVVMVLLLNVLIHRLVLRPIQAITLPLQHITAGDVQQRVQWKSSDEFGLLAKTVNEFIDAERNRVELESALKAKSDFLAVMSHEIRTPLNGVLGLSQALAKTRLADAQRAMLGSILTSGELLLSIVNNILDFSKLEAGKFQLESVAADVGELCRTVAQTFLPKCHDKNIRLYVDADISVAPTFQLDVAKVRQVMMNLIGNAIKFTNEGSVTVTARYTDGALSLAVTDTGIGMAEADMNKLFQSFSQVDASTTRKYGGTGLGLAISLGFVNLMRGKISVRSEPGRGSTFTVTIPISPDDAPANAYPSNITGQRTLLLSNDPQYIGVVTALSKEFSRETAVVRSSGEALTLPEPLPFDIVFLDTDTAMLDDISLPIVQSWLGDGAIVISSLLTPNQAIMSNLQAVGVTKFITGYVTRSQIINALVSGDAANAPTQPARTTSVLQGRMLLVDDIDMNRAVVHALLAEHDVTIDDAESGYVALERLNDKRYDVVLMDCHMPGMDGFETTKICRTREADKGLHTPIIALTASTGEERKQACFDAGMDAFVSKPFRESELIEVLSRYLATTTKTPSASANLPANGAAEHVDASTPSTPDSLTRLKATMGAQFDAQIQKLLETTHTKLTQIAEAIATRDSNTIYQHAHSLKGSWGLLGVTTVQHASAELEELAKQGDLTNAAVLHRKVENGVSDFEKILAAAPATNLA